MKSAIKILSVAAVLLALGGCVYPDYGYVRSDGYYGDAYYGTYYGPYGGYSPYYYGSGYYGPAFGLGVIYSSGSRGFHGRGYHGRGGFRGGYRGGYRGGFRGGRSHR